jgi:hypothetical protein
VVSLTEELEERPADVVTLHGAYPTGPKGQIRRALLWREPEVCADLGLGLRHLLETQLDRRSHPVCEPCDLAAGLAREVGRRVLRLRLVGPANELSANDGTEPDADETPEDPAHYF